MTEVHFNKYIPKTSSKAHGNLLKHYFLEGLRFLQAELHVESYVSVSSHKLKVYCFIIIEKP